MRPSLGPSVGPVIARSVRLLALPLILAAPTLGTVGSAATVASSPEPASAACQEVACPTASLAEGRSGHSATRLADGSVLVIGGGTDFWGVLPRTAERWDPTTQHFRPAGSLGEGRYGHAAILLADGRVLVVGGYATPDGEVDVLLASAEIWDPATETFSPTGSLALARANPGAVLLADGRVLVLGGDSGAEEMTDTTEIWDPAAGTFGPGPTLTQPRGFLDAVLLDDGRVLAVGGTADYPGTAEVLDVATGTSTPTGTVSVRGTFRTTLLDDGRVLAVGGDGSRRGTAAETWDPTTGLWSPAGAPTGGYSSYHAQTRLEDGRVLVMLGRGELWDPMTGGFAPVGPALPPAGLQTATLLDDGRVLVVGGQAGAIDQHQAFTGAAESLADAAIWDLRSAPTSTMTPLPAP